MTLILGVEDRVNGTATLFADRGMFRSNNGVERFASPKIWRDDGWIVGLSGMSSHSQIVRQIPIASSAETEPEIVDALLAWTERVARRLGEIESICQQIEHEKSVYPNILVARAGFVFHMDSISALRGDRPYAAIGAGWTYATGAMAALIEFEDRQPIWHHAMVAMRAAAAVCDAVVAPFDALSTDGKEDRFS